MGLTKILSGEPLPIAPPNQSPEMNKFLRELLNYLRRLCAKFTGVNIKTTLYEEAGSFASVPIGAIVLWSDYDVSGVPQNIPTGWALCDGQVHSGVTTLDLRGKFVVGYHSEVGDYDDCTATGGFATHGNSVNDHTGHPQHLHSFTTSTALDDAAADYGLNTSAPGESMTHHHSGNTDYASGEGHTSTDNRPPYRVLAYIQRIA